jgi:hypothetical protein
LALPLISEAWPPSLVVLWRSDTKSSARPISLFKILTAQKSLLRGEIAPRLTSRTSARAMAANGIARSPARCEMRKYA